MRRDKIIEDKLNKLADNMVVKQSILTPAMVLFKTKKPEIIVKTRMNYRAKSLRPMYYFAAMIILLVLSISIINVFHVEPYNLSSLNKQKTSAAKVLELNDNILLINTDNQTEEYYIYYRDNIPMLVLIDYVVVTDNGTDKVTVYADLKGKLKDYQNYRNFPDFEGYNVNIRASEVYTDGEFYTYTYLRYKGIDYYIIIMSPNGNQAEKYYDIILN